MGADEMCRRLGIDRDTLARMFMSTGDITDLWSISAQRLDQLIARDGAPQAVARVRGGKLFMTGDVQRYAVEHDRPVPRSSE
jgi:hypothetical protein